MSVAELIASLQNIADKEAEVVIRTTEGFSGVERVVVGSAGMCIDLNDAIDPSTIRDVTPPKEQP